MSSVARASKYTYRASSGGIADVNIEYSADLTALTRLEVKRKTHTLNYQIIPIGRSEQKKQQKEESRMDFVWYGFGIMENPTLGI